MSAVPGQKVAETRPPASWFDTPLRGYASLMTNEKTATDAIAPAHEGDSVDRAENREVVVTEPEQVEDARNAVTSLRGRSRPAGDALGMRAENSTGPTDRKL